MAKKRKNKSKLIRVVVVLSVLYLFASFGVAMYFTSSWRFSGGFAMPDFQRVEFTTTDSVKIVGRYAGTGDRPVLVMAHDFHETSNQFKDLARHLSQRSFDVFLFDFRGHGDSASAEVGFSSTEAADVDAAIDYVIRSRGGKRFSLGFVGVGTGASAFLHSNSTGLVDCAVLAHCFEDLEAMLDRNVRQTLRVPLRPLCSLAISLAEWRTGAKLSQVKPAQRVAETRQLPFLFLHDLTTETMGEKLFHAAGPESQLYVHPAAETSFRKLCRDGSVNMAVVEFLQRWM